MTKADTLIELREKIDVQEIADRMTQNAYKNKTGVSTAIHGAVAVRAKT